MSWEQIEQATASANQQAQWLERGVNPVAVVVQGEILAIPGSEPLHEGDYLFSLLSLVQDQAS